MELCGVADSGESRTSRASESSTEQTDRQTDRQITGEGGVDLTTFVRKRERRKPYPTLPYPNLVEPPHLPATLPDVLNGKGLDGRT